jgi:ribA/ribD-fused uncharacterized protein
MYIRHAIIRKTINFLGKTVGFHPIAYPPIPTDNRILFYKRDRKEFCFLSNFYLSPIVIKGVLWPDVEHYYQAQKSTNPAYQAAVMSAPTPGKAKRLGDSRVGDKRIAKKSWFRKRPDLLRPDWNDIKLVIMKQTVTTKFSQNRELRKMLLATGQAELVEDSGSDFFWGWGSDQSGQNHLGKLIMELRAELSDKL